MRHKAKAIYHVGIRAVVALRLCAVEDRLQLVQVGQADVLLDPGVGDVVLAIGGGDEPVGLHDQGRLPCDPILQPDLLPRGVQGAVAGWRNLQLREARRIVGVQLQPGHAGAGGVLEHGPHGARCGRPGDGALGLVVLDLQQRVERLI